MDGSKPAAPAKAARESAGLRRHFPRMKVILAHIHAHIVRDNISLVARTAILGAMNRLFALLGMALTFKAIISALAPEATLGRLNPLLAKFDVAISVDSLMLLMAGLVLSAYTTSWICQMLRDRCLSRLIWRVVKRQEILARQRLLDDDLFLIEDITPRVQTVTRVLEIIAFSSMFVAVIAVFAGPLLVVLLPLLLAFVVFMVHYERSRVRQRHEQKQAQAAYVNERTTDGAVRRRVYAADVAERDDYIRAREALRDGSAGVARNATLVSGAIMVLIVLYVGTLEIGIGNFPFIPLFLVVSIRSLVAYSQELGRSLTQILELRGSLARAIHESAK